MKKLIFISLLFPFSLSAQIGGRGIYDFLNLSNSARVTALGGYNVALRDDDVGMGYQNPALLNDSMHQKLSFSVVNYIADVSYGYAGYAHHLPKIGTLHGGIQYVNYGKFVEADEYGNQLGNYRASNIALFAGLARAYKRFDYGVNMKIINSNISTFSSWGMGFDVGGAYHSKDELLMVGAVVKNAGFQLSKYTPTAKREDLPTQFQAGVSYKLLHMPLRFCATVTNLETPLLVYVDPNPVQQTDLAGNPIKVRKMIGDKIARHFIFGGEFLLGKNLRLRAAYNYMRRQELKAENRGGLSGFTLGFGLKVSYFTLDYGFAKYDLGSSVNQFSVGMNIGKFKKKPKTD